MELSIIITVYNKAEYVARCIESCINQDDCELGKEYELVVVNDGSSDDSLNIIMGFSSSYRNYFTVVNQTNQGLSMARNNGRKYAKGKYIWFVDADDIISKMSVSLIVRASQSQPDIIPIRGAYIDSSDKPRNVIDKDLTTGKDILKKQCWEVCSPFYVYRSNFLLKNDLSFYPGIFHEDDEFTPRVLYYANTATVIDKVLYYIYRVEGSITQIPNVKRAYDYLTVARRLNEFVLNNQENTTLIGVRIMNLASICINNAFSIIVKNSQTEQHMFNKQFNSESDLMKLLWKSNNRKYRLESILFRLFPGNCVGVYKFLKRIR